MKFCYGLEKKRFDEKWKKLAEEYREAGMREDAIEEMYRYDLQMFRDERTYCRHNQFLESGQIWPKGDPSDAEDPAPMDKSNFLKKYGDRLCYQPEEVDPDRRDYWIDLIEDEELARRIIKLSQKEKELITLRVYEEYSFEEIARIFGEKADTVSRRFRRLMKRLRGG